MVTEGPTPRYTDEQLRAAEILGVDIPITFVVGGFVYAVHYASGALQFFTASDRVEAREIAREYGKRILNWDELVSVHALDWQSRTDYTEDRRKEHMKSADGAKFEQLANEVIAATKEVERLKDAEERLADARGAYWDFCVETIS